MGVRAKPIPAPENMHQAGIEACEHFYITICILKVNDIGGFDDEVEECVTIDGMVRGSFG